MFNTILSAQELHNQLEAINLVIIDCRFSLKDKALGRRSYQEGHIPKAIYAHLDEDLSGEIIPNKTGRHPLPTIEKAIRIFSKWGINQQTQVVVYDNMGGAIAARLWWMLRWLGHDKVAVLDGGIQQWMADGFQLTNKISKVVEKTFIPKPRPELVVNADFVSKILDNPNYRLIDSRAKERYLGEFEPIDPIAGHIPSAINVPFAENKTQNGCFLGKKDLTNRFTTILENITPTNVIFYCGSGVTACHNLLAIYHAGMGEGRLYAGSWSDWIIKMP